MPQFDPPLLECESYPRSRPNTCSLPIPLIRGPARAGRVMPEACLQHDAAGAAPLLNTGTISPEHFPDEVETGSSLENATSTEAGKVRSGCSGLMDREANARTVDVRSCRRHASSMIGFALVEVVSRWSGLISHSPRRDAGQRRSGVLPESGRQSGRIPECYPRPDAPLPGGFTEPRSLN